MNFKLVHQTERQRFYECDTEIVNFPRKIDLQEEIEYQKTRLKPGIVMLSEKPLGVCISDAHTHLERLVFLATKYRLANGEEVWGTMSMIHIDGSLTMLIHGGDRSTMKPDEVYLRRIKMANRVTEPSSVSSTDIEMHEGK